MPSVEISDEEMAKLAALRAAEEIEEGKPSKKTAKGKTGKAFESGEDELAARQARADEEALKARLNELERQAAVTAPQAPAYGGWTKPVEFDIELPTGTRCRAKKLSMEDAMSLGLLDSLDMFTSALMKPILDATPDGKRDEQQTKLLESLKDPEKRATFFGTVNRVVAHTVVIPKVVMQTNENGDVNEGEVFAGDIPFTD